MFPIRNGLKQGDVLSSLLINFALEYAIKRVQVNQDGLKLNGALQLLANADDVIILGGSVHTVKENTEALVVATKEIGLEVNADKTKYMVMSRDRNAGRGHGVKIDNSSFERIKEFKYLGTINIHLFPLDTQYIVCLIFYIKSSTCFRLIRPSSGGF
jgi:hypothetical protein